MSLKIDRKELDAKNKLIDDAIIQLKKEFVGIDEQIESIMNNVRVWFLYPQLQTSPCVINVFGMTGCGKTSLIKRISQLLDMEKNLVYFNFCAINEQNSWEVEQDIEEQLDNECSRRMFVYDEFQYAATIDPSDGSEKDNKNGLKPFWELLDTGILHKRTSFSDIRELYKIISNMMRVNTVCPMKIKDGVWTNATEALINFNAFDIRQILNIFVGTDTSDVNPRIIPHCSNVDELDDVESSDNSGLEKLKEKLENEEKTFFLDNYYLRRFSDLYGKVYNVVCDTIDVRRKLETLNGDEILELFNDVYEKSLIGYNLKFNDSIIFVVANLDEAYDVAFNVNPDMSADQFYNITKKISIVDIKKALQKRFRNEQIARLGNIHVIYPSFNSKSFKKIIELNLNAYKETAKELCGLDVNFDSSVTKVIFDEAVFPTHGTRPIFSTIHEFIKTKLPYIIRNICDANKEKEAVSITYSYKGKKSVVTVYDAEDNVIDTYKFVDKLRLNALRESTKDEQQANTAVHESGHFVIYSYLNGRVPEKIISRSAERTIEGFMMHNVEDENSLVWSKSDYLNEIKVCLGGYVAEGLIFGDDKRSSGASNDLERATMTASKMVRKWGMYGTPCVTTHLYDTRTEGLFIREEDQTYINDSIKRIVDDCLSETIAIMKQPNIMSMLKKSSKYLANHSSMPKHIMNELLDEARKNGDICDNNETYYRDIVNKF